MDGIKDHIERIVHMHGEGHGFKIKTLNDDLMCLIELVEEAQINIVERNLIPGDIKYHSDIKDQLSEMPLVSQQLTEKE